MKLNTEHTSSIALRVRTMNMTDILNKYGLVAGFIVLCIIMSVLSPVFLTQGNIINILRQVSVTGITAVGMTFAIIAAGVDLSVGSILAFSGVVLAMTQSKGLVIGLVAALVSGAFWGLVNGLAITKGKIQPFVVTLASMTFIAGFTLIISGGQPITLSNNILLGLGYGYLGPIPWLVIVFAFILLVGWVLLSKTRFGRYTYAIGSSESASKLAGIKLDRVKILIYIFSGTLAALAGVLLTARLSSASPIAGTGYELDAISAVAIGGASLLGGEGTMGGTLLGILIVGVIDDGLVLLNVNSYVQQVVQGLIILGALLLANRKSR